MVLVVIRSLNMETFWLNYKSRYDRHVSMYRALNINIQHVSQRKTNLINESYNNKSTFYFTISTVRLYACSPDCNPGKIRFK